MKKYHYIPLIVLSIFGCQPEQSYDNLQIEWATYLGDSQSTQSSPADEINQSNVSQLKLAWSYDGQEAHPEDRSQIQCNPLVIDGVLYGTTATLKLIALDAVTGKLIWEYDPYESQFDNFGMGVNRGLMYYDGGMEKILFYGAGRYITAIDPSTGSIITSFGNKGKIDLQAGIGKDKNMMVLANTPGIIYKDLIIIGGRVSESTRAAPGHIRAFNIHTGQQEWIFHTIPKPGEAGHDTWPKDAHQHIGGANVWTGMALDEERGIVYCPTGSAAYDFYGGDRHGSNLYANSILALDAITGEYIWHFQSVHHDMWDKDHPAPPNLFTLQKDGNEVPALAQITKNGTIFIFNRVTGEALYPIQEIPVPESQLIGEQAWSTQPVPEDFPPFSRTSLTEADLANRNQEAKDYAQTVWNTTRHEGGPFEPPSEQGTIIFPGFDGGGEWGGAAYDKEEGNLIINSNEMPWRNIMDEVKPASMGESIYKVQCQSCHGKAFKGNQLYGNIPSLVNLSDRISLPVASLIISKGKGIMPSFSHLEEESIQAIYHYINGRDTTELQVNEEWPYPYSLRGYEKLYAPDGYPIITPPWGQLTSINVAEAKVNWQIPLGEHDELSKKGMAMTGTENYGGPVVTSGGLIFIAATMDEKIRAFDKYSGELLWSYDLPAAGYATPATYVINGKQYVVIACGGGKLGTKSGDYWMAFSL